MIGSSRPMVSKLISDMTREGLLTRGENRHFILCTQARASVRTGIDTVQPSMRVNGVSKQVAGSGVFAKPPGTAEFSGAFSKSMRPRLNREQTVAKQVSAGDDLRPTQHE
jgi:hypothetical protein